MNNLRTFEIKYLGPTNYKGSRIKIKDLRFWDTKTISYDYTCNSAYEWAIKYIISNYAISIDFVSEWKDVMYLHSENFDNRLV